MGPDRLGEALAQLNGELGTAFLAQVRSSGGAGRAKRSIVTASGVHVSTWPGASLRAALKIVSGAGIELKVRKACSASRSTSRLKSGWQSSALSSEAKAILPSPSS